MEGRGPAEDLWAGRKLALILHIKEPSFCRPAGAAQRGGVSCRELTEALQANHLDLHYQNRKIIFINI